MAAVVDILRANRAQLKALAETRGIRQLRSIYEDARSSLESQLASLVKAGRGESFTAHHMRTVLVQVRDSLKHFEGEFAGLLAEQGRLAGSLANKHLIKTVKQLEKRYSGHTPVLRTEEAAVFQRVYSHVEPSLLDRFDSSVQLYTKPVIANVRNELAKSVLQNETIDATVSRIVSTGGVFEAQRWRAERIARTESSYAYGVVKQQSMAELSKDVGGLQKKLIETFDDRTGEDSKELHGQVVDWDKPFIWHVKDSKGHDTGKVVQYMQPPNRPNDRAIVIPWRVGWPETAATRPREK